MQRFLQNLIRAKSSCRFLQTGILLLVMLANMASHAIAADNVLSEYKLKAALLYKLTHFVEWPVMASSPKSNRFNICLLGRDDFGNALDSLSTRKVNGLSIAIYRFSYSTGIDKQCQLLFISDSKQAFLSSIIQTLGKQPVLTISDARDFAEQGGMIQFVSEKKRIGFRINLRKARAANLKIAAPLLELATIISTRKHQDKP